MNVSLNFTESFTPILFITFAMSQKTHCLSAINCIREVFP